MASADNNDAHQPPVDLLSELESEEFTGYTSFKELSAEEKLLWLAHAAAFALEARRAREDKP